MGILVMAAGLALMPLDAAEVRASVAAGGQAVTAQASATVNLAASAAKVTLPYGKAHERQVLDIYAPPGARDLPVVFWIHGGGWQVGDKSDVALKPQWFAQLGFVFVAPNYRLLPQVDMQGLTEDVAAALGWVNANIARHGGNPKRILVGGHSAGAQLAALMCCDGSWVGRHGMSLSQFIGCVPVDGDTYDIPAIIEVAETRRRLHHQQPVKNGHREKFMNSAEKHRFFSAVSHIGKGLNIPPFLVLHVAAHPDTSAQAYRLVSALRESGVEAQAFGARNTDHSLLNNRLGLADDAATAQLLAFVQRALKRP